MLVRKRAYWLLGKSEDKNGYKVARFNILLDWCQDIWTYAELSSLPVYKGIHRTNGTIDIVNTRMLSSQIAEF
jgi:hypothetical protein